MAVDDQIRGGTLSPEQLEALEAQVERAMAPLEGRIGALEDNATGDGAAFPALYQVTQEGEVFNEFVEFEAEEGEGEEEEEGEILFTGKGKKKVKKLKKGLVGDVLTIGPGGDPEWRPPSGGGESPFKRVEAGVVFIPPETGEIEEILGSGFTAQDFPGSPGLYKVFWNVPWDNQPTVLIESFNTGQTGFFIATIDGSPTETEFDVMVLKTVPTLPDGPTLKEINHAGFSFQFLAYEMA